MTCLELNLTTLSAFEVGQHCSLCCPHCDVLGLRYAALSAIIIAASNTVITDRERRGTCATASACFSAASALRMAASASTSSVASSGASPGAPPPAPSEHMSASCGACLRSSESDAPPPAPPPLHPLAATTRPLTSYFTRDRYNYQTSYLRSSLAALLNMLCTRSSAVERSPSAPLAAAFLRALYLMSAQYCNTGAPGTVSERGSAAVRTGRTVAMTHPTPLVRRLESAAAVAGRRVQPLGEQPPQLAGREARVNRELARCELGVLFHKRQQHV